MKTLTEYLIFHTETHRAYLHITPQVEEILRKSDVKEGMVLVSAMHITAGVYVNDDESGLIEDIDQWLEHVAPFRNDVQGVLTAIVALLLYGRMVSILGATAGAAFVALTPAATALLAIPALGEWPSMIDWLAITVISAGVYMLSGGPLPWAPRPKKPHQNA